MAILDQIRSNPQAAASKYAGLTSAQKQKVLSWASTTGSQKYADWSSSTDQTKQQLAGATLNALPPEVQQAIVGGAGGAGGSGSSGSGGSSGAGAASASAPSLSGAATTTEASGASASEYQNQPFETIKKYVLANPDELEKMGLSITSKEDYEALKDSYAKTRADLGLSIDKMNEANVAFLRGELPLDVQAQVRRAVSESSAAGGLFGQAARALTATDLGLTSLQMVQQGISQQGAISGIQETVAKLDESVRQFNKQYDLSVNQFQEQVRLGNLQGLALEQQRLEFNAKQNLALTEMINNAIAMQQEIGYKYAASGTDPGGSNATFANWINELQTKLG